MCVMLQPVIVLGQPVHLGLIFLGDLFNIGDYILPVEAAEHTSSEICTHRYPPFFPRYGQEMICFYYNSTIRHG